jgi:hypothetical protein
MQLLFRTKHLELIQPKAHTASALDETVQRLKEQLTREKKHHGMFA